MDILITPADPAFPTEQHSIDPEDAKWEIDDLYEECVFEVNGERYVTGQKALASGPLMLERIRKVAAVTGGILKRLMFINECLWAAHRNVFHPELASKLRLSVKYSLSALGELVSTAIHSGIAGRGLPVQFHATGFPWGYGYLAEGSPLETQMLDHGWCPSEIENGMLGAAEYTLRQPAPKTWAVEKPCDLPQVQVLSFPDQVR